ncbi:MAG: extracellular solute-binding protein [Acetobacteraceae bacterium]
MGAAVALAASGTKGRAEAQPHDAVVPQRIRIVDTADSLVFAQPILDAFAGSPSGRLAVIEATRAHVSALTQLHRQLRDGAPQFDAVFVALDGLYMGAFFKIWQSLSQDLGVNMADLDDALTPLAKRLQVMAGDQGLVVACAAEGPLLVYRPDRVSAVPRTPRDLLDWTRQNPQRFLYPRPPYATAGRVFIQALPALLGDQDPSDPVNGWNQTWEYLRALGEGIDYYPTATSTSFAELTDGNCDMMATTVGWDISSRARGLAPLDTQIAFFDGQALIPEGHFLCIPRNIDPIKRPILAQLAVFLREPEQQVLVYGGGLMYPGPVSQHVTTAMMPDAMRQTTSRFVRSGIDWILADHVVAGPLPQERMRYAMQRWDEQIGADLHTQH